MNDQDIATLLREAAEPVEPPNYVPAALSRAGRARRRRPWYVAGVAGLVVASVSLLVVQVNIDRTATPTGPSPTVTSSPGTPVDRNPTAPPLERRMVQPEWSGARLPQLPWADSALPRAIPGIASGLPLLSQSPVTRALMAITTPGSKGTAIAVLGVDGGWRLVDVPLTRVRDAARYLSAALSPQSLSPDGTMLAVPQPRELVLIDLATGSATRYDVPGLNTSAMWTADGAGVLLTTEQPDEGSLVHLDDGTITPVGYGRLTTFSPDGTVLTMSYAHPDQLRTYAADGRLLRVVDEVPMMAGSLMTEGPLANGSALAGVYEAGGYTPPRDPEELGGVLVVDENTGEPLTLLPIRDFGELFRTGTIDWLDDTTLLLRVTTTTNQDHLITWNYATGELARVSTMPSDLVISVAANLIR